MVDPIALSQDMLQQAHELTALPAVWMQYVVMMVTLFLCGLFIARRSGKFWAIFALTGIVGAICAFGIGQMPNVVQAVKDFVVGAA